MVEKTKTVTKKKSTKRTVRETGLTVDVFDVVGKVAGKKDLPKEIFNVKENDQLVAQAVRVYQARQRQGTASTKTRGEVQGSTRKIYRQKGTGRARHGAIRAPIFVGGGIVFGPKPRSYDLKLSAKMRAEVLKSALTGKFKDHDVLIVEDLSGLAPKTREMMKALQNLKLETDNGKLKTKTLLVLPKYEEKIIRACRNIENLTLSPANLLNAYLILANKKIIFTKDALEVLWKQPAS